MRQCPVCTRRVPNFLPLPNAYFDVLQRLNVAWSLEDFETLNVGQYSCPHCAASDRDRLYALWVRCLLERTPNAPLRVLDIAPAPALSQFLRAQPGVVYRSADLRPGMACDTVDICAMPGYADGAFDLVVCSHVLEHVPDDAAAIRELHRVLAAGGSAILMVPILSTASRTDEDPALADVAQRWARFGQDDHVRMYARDDFLARLAAGGFTVHGYGAEDFGSALLRQCGVTVQSRLYIGTKGTAAGAGAIAAPEAGRSVTVATTTAAVAEAAA